MNLFMIDDFTGIDWDNIDIIEPIKDENDNIKAVMIFTKSKSCLNLSIEQYRQLLLRRSEYCRKLYDRGDTK